MADPICRWRNATPETVCELVHELPKEKMSSKAFRALMEKSKFGKDFFHTPYQLACQLALYVETDTYIPRFSRDISIEEARTYLVFWFSKYYVPNPYTKQGFKELNKPILIEQSFVDYIKSHNGICDLEEAYKELFHENEIGEMDIFTNAISAYSQKIKLNSKSPVILENGKKKKLFSIELKGDFSKMNVDIDRDDKEGFFNFFEEKSKAGQKLQLPRNNARKCAKKIFEILWEEDNFNKLKPFIKNGINLGLEHSSIKESSLANVFCTDKSTNFKNKTRTFQDNIYEFDIGENQYITKLTTQWQGFNTEDDNYQRGRTYLWALRDIVNICYSKQFLIENNGEEAWIIYLNENADVTISESNAISNFKKCYEKLITDKKAYYKRYIRALVQKPFVILTGNSGTGKTKIAIDFAKVLEESFSDGTINSLVVQVGADWTDTSKMLGFYNPINKEYKKTTILEFIETANKHSSIPFFLILDEMNLSHVERYFSDFLSLMETPNLSFELDNYDSISFPKNLFVTGTVNIDETTYMFSPKVLDRANVIEFIPEQSDVLANFAAETQPIEIEPVNDGSAEGFLALAKTVRETTTLPAGSDICKTILEGISNILDGSGFEFAFRTAKEIRLYINAAYALAQNDEKTLSEEDYVNLMDEQLLQKVLPKVHGNRSQVGTLLSNLSKYSEEQNLKESKKKIDRMLKQLETSQFTSFI